MRAFKTITERYCPMISGNVPVEVTFKENGERCEQCLHHYGMNANCERCKGFDVGNMSIDNVEQ